MEQQRSRLGNRFRIMKSLAFRCGFLIMTGVVFLLALPLHSQVKITAEVRPRAEYRDGFKTLNTDGQDAAFFVEQRSRLGLNFQNESISLQLTLQDVRFWGGVSQIYKQDNNLFNVYEAWGKYKFSDKSAIKVGRQELDYDNARILGNLAWAQQGRSHDLIKYEYASNGFIWHIGAAFNQEFVNANPEPARLSGTFYSGVNNYKTMQFTWLHKKYEEGKISFLALSNGVQAADSSVNFSFTTGSYWNHQFSSIKVTGEAYYQFGKDPTGTDLNAYMIGLEIGTKVGANAVSIGVDHLSGTSASDTENKSFIPLFGTNHKFYGLMDYFYVGNNHQNVGLTDVFVKTNWKLSEKSNMLVHLHQFTSPVSIDDADGNSLTKSLGQEVDLVFNHKVAKDVNWKLGFSALSGNQTLETIKTGDDNGLNYWGWTMLTIKPSFFLAIN